MKILLQLWFLAVFCPIALGEGNKGGYSEESPATHKGTHRQTRADPCTSSPCLHGGRCTTRLDGSFQCTCQKVWTGARCERCLCQNGGRCDYSPIDGHVCRCQAGFIGTKCEVEENECDSYPCWNGICMDLVNDYKCDCDPGYTGKNCDVKSAPTIVRNECYRSPCLHGGRCTTQLDGTFQCTCQKVWTGARCEQCLCQNGGRCDYSPSVGHVCRCQAGFIGTKCEVEENECDSYPCYYGICIDLVNDYKCTCDPGYTGKNCNVKSGSLIG